MDKRLIALALLAGAAGLAHAEAIGGHLKGGRRPQSALYGDGAAGPRIADRLSNVELKIEKRLTY